MESSLFHNQFIKGDSLYWLVLYGFRESSKLNLDENCVDLAELTSPPLAKARKRLNLDTEDVLEVPEGS